MMSASGKKLHHYSFAPLSFFYSVGLTLTKITSLPPLTPKLVQTKADDDVEK